MTRRIPLVATAVVLLAAAVMVALGFWQLGRMAEKEALLTQFQQARSARSEVPWPRRGEDYSAALYRKTQIHCAVVERIDAVAGRSTAGRAGWAQIAQCRLENGDVAAVALGWSPGPEAARWKGGQVSGAVGPAGRGIRLIAAPAQAGLAELAPPDPANIPNNHLSYAVQWFAFAVTALVIYALALRRRARGV